MRSVIWGHHWTPRTRTLLPLWTNRFCASSPRFSTLQQFPRFTGNAQLFTYVNEHLGSMDNFAIIGFLKHLAAHLNDPNLARDQKNLIRSSEEFKTLITKATDFIRNNEDIEAISTSVAATASSSKNLPIFYNCAQKLFSFLQTQDVSPSNFSISRLTSVIQNLVKLGFKDISFSAFIRNKLPLYHPSLSVEDCCTLLSCVTELKDFKLNKMLLERIQSNALISPSQCGRLLHVMSRYDFVEPNLQMTCKNLLISKAVEFETEDLLTSAKALINLQSFGSQTSKPIVTELITRTHSMEPYSLSTSLRVLTFSLPTQYSEEANAMTRCFANLVLPTNLFNIACVAHAICYFDLKGKIVY